MNITCISDLHGHFPKLPGGDLLIVAGDITSDDSFVAHSETLTWLHSQKYEKKILVAGNHDGFLEKNNNFYKDTSVTYLCDSCAEYKGYKIWGSPWTSLFHGVNPHCKAFMIHERKLKNKWALIPSDTDILVTHNPPNCILDINRQDKRCGCALLRKRVMSIRPKLHVFGHIHGGSGIDKESDEGIIYVNASILNEDYIYTNPPKQIELPSK